MRTKQLMLEILLLNEKYSQDEIFQIKELIIEKDNKIIECLTALQKLNNNLNEKSKTIDKSDTQKRINIKNVLTNLRKSNEKKYKIIKQIESDLQDTSYLNLQEIREYAKTLNVQFESSIKRPTLIRHIIFHLIDLPDEKILPLNKNQNKKTNQLEILSRAIITNHKN